jgi:nucleoside-diphosphate-sugar epimerase
MRPAVEGCVAVVTGSSGLCGRRLLEMLLERGAKKVIAFDREAAPAELAADARVRVVKKANLCDRQSVFDACEGADVVFHLAALVGPFYAHEQYDMVNYEGTVNVIEACKFHRVPRLVYSSSPSTRFTGANVRGLREDQMTICEPGHFLEPYAESKARGEVAVRDACCDELMTIAVAPHQVYGEWDPLFLPNFLASADRLRVFGSGENEVSVCYVGNYCHGLMLGYTSLVPGSPSLGKYYVVTDGGKCKLWRLLDSAIVAMGSESLFSRAHLPVALLYCVSYVGKLANARLTPFVVTMLTIDRYFDISNAEKDLGYTPLVQHDAAWQKTIEWFKNHRDWWQEKARGTIKK